jgi:hypothetical protein
MECAKMAPSTSYRAVHVSNQNIYGPVVPSWGDAVASVSKAKAPGPSMRQVDGEVAAVKRRIALMEYMISDFDRLAADLNREILIEEERARIHDPAHFAYPTYAKASALRRDNLKRSADELRARLTNVKKALPAAII